jgi:hypothetical protein
MTHKHKIKITDPNSFHHEFEDRTEIGGSYGEPTTLYMFLDDNEFKALMLFMGEVSEKRHDLALFNFLQSEVISKWHKYLIQYNFETLTEGIKIEIL